MSLARKTTVFFAILMVSAVGLGQVSQKPLQKKQPAKKTLSSRGVSGGPTQLVAAGSDDCSAPQAIAGQGTFPFDLTNASTGSESQNEYLCYQFGVSGIDNDVWFNWTADVSGTASINTCAGTSIDTKIAAYPDSGGGCPTPGSALDCNDDTCTLESQLYFSCVASSTYSLQVGTFPGASGGAGSLTIAITGDPLSEDDCATPVAIAGPGTWDYSTLSATTGTEGQNEALCDQFDSVIIAKDIWFEWTATEDGYATVQTCSLADHDTKIAAYPGAGCPADGTAVACNDDTCDLSSLIQFAVQSGSVYTLQVGCFSEAAGLGSIQIGISGSGGAANDDCANAEAITGEGVFPYDNALATTEGITPSCVAVGADVWFAWTSPGTYDVEVSTCGHTGLDTVLAVYDGAPCNGAAELSCNDDSCNYQSEVIFSAVTGATYWFQVANWQDSIAGPGAIEVETGVVNPCGQTTGPDVIVGAIPDTMFWGTDGGRAGYSWASTACNVGDMEMGWWANTNVHPVIAQNMYRIEDGRFEQLGMSWLKHGWASATESYCCNCQNPNNSQVTGIGCADTYGAGSNGGQDTMGPRWEVNPYTGEFPFPYGAAGQTGPAAYKRLSVDVADLDPSAHPNARFIAEVQYIQPEDSEYGNQMDNVSWRDVTLGSFGGGSWDLNLEGDTTVSEPAILAWVAETGARLDTVDVPDEGRFHVGSLVTETSPGTWRYDYVLYNQNFTRGMESLELSVGNGASVWGDTFHAPPHHSGDPQSNAAWSFATSPGGAEWRTDSYATNPNANVVVWGKAHSLSFLSDQAPVLSAASVDLFDSSVAGLPLEAEVEVWTPEAACGVTRHCTPSPNSTGAASTLHWYGPASVSTNAALLFADNLPAGTPGLFFYGTTAIEVPFGDGFRCAGGDVTRLNPALFASPQGDVARPLDFNASPLSSEAAGDSLVLQFWYRDTAAGASGFNLSDALIVILCP